MAIQTLIPRCWIAVLGTVLGLCAPVEAAESIRVLMASDVHRLEVRADSVVWVTDAQNRSHAYKSSLDRKSTRLNSSH